MAACRSLAAVGKVMAFGCTVVSTVTRLRSWPRNAPASCATRRLSASSSSSLSPSRLRQSLRSERSCGKLSWKNSSGQKIKSAGNLTLGNGNAGRTDVELGGTEEEVVDVGLAARRLM